jgi:hypothetical protein
MGIFLVILLLTMGLGLRAVAANRRTSLAGSETSDDPGFVDSYARTSLLVPLCLVALLALGLTYGNVLGAGAGR